jgi:hypothetical protein
MVHKFSGPENLYRFQSKQEILKLQEAKTDKIANEKMHHALVGFSEQLWDWDAL